MPISIAMWGICFGLAWWTNLQAEIGWPELWKRFAILAAMAYPMTIIGLMKIATQSAADDSFWAQIRNRRGRNRDG